MTKELLTSKQIGGVTSLEGLQEANRQMLAEIERLQDSINRCSTEEGLCYAVELERKDKGIERLIAELASLKDAFNDRVRIIEIQLKDKDRLRAALQGLYDAVWESDPAARATVAARDTLLGKQPVESRSEADHG